MATTLQFAKQHGARAVEGFPLAEGPKRRADGCFGTEQVFAACGFTELRRPTERRVVLRRELTGQG